MIALGTELRWYLVRLLLFGPVFGALCALLARELNRRGWAWFILGVFTGPLAGLIIATVWIRARIGPKGNVDASRSR